MICISTTVAFEAIARTLPLGSVSYEAEADERGERLIWLEDAMVDLLFPPSAKVLCSTRRGTGRSTRRTCTSCFHARLVRHGSAAMLKPMIDIPLASLRCPPGGFARTTRNG
jgi:hypothetical protein